MLWRVTLLRRLPRREPRWVRCVGCQECALLVPASAAGRGVAWHGAPRRAQRIALVVCGAARATTGGVGAVPRIVDSRGLGSRVHMAFGICQVSPYGSYVTSASLTPWAGAAGITSA